MLSFFSRRKGQCFDKLSTNGEGESFRASMSRLVLAAKAIARLPVMA